MSSTGLLIAVLTGAWIGHLLEYIRVWGPGQFPLLLTRDPHKYLGPVGIVLLALAVIGVQVSMRTARRLERRLEQLRAALLGGPPPSDLDGPPTGRAVSLPTLLVACWTIQLGLYVAQENLEARAFGLPMPGTGAVSGSHAWAPLVHLAVAGTMAIAVWLTRRRVTELSGESAWARDCLARRGHRPVAISRAGVRGRAWTPGERWGMALWARPPPNAAA